MPGEGPLFFSVNEQAQRVAGAVTRSQALAFRLDPKFAQECVILLTQHRSLYATETSLQQRIGLLLESRTRQQLHELDDFATQESGTIEKVWTYHRTFVRMTVIDRELGGLSWGSLLDQYPTPMDTPAVSRASLEDWIERLQGLINQRAKLEVMIHQHHVGIEESRFFKRTDSRVCVFFDRTLPETIAHQWNKIQQLPDTVFFNVLKTVASFIGEAVYLILCEITDNSFPMLTVILAIQFFGFIQSLL